MLGSVLQRLKMRDTLRLSPHSLYGLEEVVVDALKSFYFNLTLSRG